MLSGKVTRRQHQCLCSPSFLFEWFSLLLTTASIQFSCSSFFDCFVCIFFYVHVFILTLPKVFFVSEYWFDPIRRPVVFAVTLSAQC